MTRRRTQVIRVSKSAVVPPGAITAGQWAATEEAILRTDPGDNPADSMVIRNASGTPVSVASPHVYAVARGFVPSSNAAGVAENNRSVIQQIWDEGRVAILPKGSHYYSGTLLPVTSCGLLGTGTKWCLLYHVGSGDGIRARTDLDGIGGINDLLFEGVRIIHHPTLGTGSGHGINTNSIRASAFRDFAVQQFPGSGWYASNIGAQGTWSNRYDNVAFNYNGRMGMEMVGGDHNAHAFHAVTTNTNGLDGFYAENLQGPLSFDIQSEGNGRHAFHLLGGFGIDASSVYIEHQQPSSDGTLPPGFVVQSPRYCIKLGAAPNGTRLRSFVCNNALLSSKHGHATIPATVTDGILYAENTDYIEMVGNYVGTVADDTKAFQVASTCGRRVIHSNKLSGSAETDATRYQMARYQHGVAPSRVPLLGPMSQEESVTNLLTNGGFDTWPTSPGVPPGWLFTSSAGAPVVSRELGSGSSGSGYRAVLTGSGVASEFAFLYQTISGQDVIRAARHGWATLVFDAIIPTSNTNNAAGVRIICQDSSGTGTLANGGQPTALANLPKSDTEQTYALTFAVPATTEIIQVRFQNSVSGTANSDVLKVDRVALYVGRVPKMYQPKMLPAPVAPAANPDTSGAALAALETEVNELKAALRTAGIIGS